MRRHRFFQRMPAAEALKQSRFLKPFSRYLDRHFLWQFNRKTVAGGVAVGLFFGILSPVAQILLAAVGAVALRVNLPVAAFSTLITNPFTVPPIYYTAYRLGDVLTRSDAMPDTFYEQSSEVIGLLSRLVDWALGVGLLLLLGLAVFAVVSAVLGYFAVSGLWQLLVRLRWRKRRRRTN